MKIIKNSKELAKLVDKNKDLRLPDEDVQIEFEPTREELKDIYCKNLFLMDDNQRFDFNGRNFNGRDFNGGNFNGGDFNGRDFNGGDFNGGNFNGKKVSYWGFFNCYGSIKCESIKGRRELHAEPICLNGELEIIKPAEESLIGKEVEVKIGDKVYKAKITQD